MQTEIPQQLVVFLEEVEFLGGVGKGQKLCLKSFSYTDSSYTSYIWRRLKGEGFEETRDFVRKITQQIGTNLASYRVHDELIRSKVQKIFRGIKLLKETYSDNTDMNVSLNISLEIIYSLGLREIEN
jgi:hypothetical protein